MSSSSPPSLPSSSWFTEAWSPEGSAFSLQLEELLHQEQSDYQELAIYQTKHWGRLMVLDGCYMVTERDNFLYHEMMSHPALFTHPNPKRVAIIGGGDCGTLREVLKHPTIEQVWQIEIDERVTRLSEQYFPSLCEANQDPRATLLFEDGIAWIAACPAGSLDVIIIDSTDPVGPAAGLFDRRFLSACQQALSDDGILVQQSESPLFHAQTLIADLHQELQAAQFSHRHTLGFPQPCYPSGWWSCTLASQTLDVTGFRQDDAANKAWPTLYYNAGIHQAALAQPEFMKHLRGHPDAE